MRPTLRTFTLALGIASAALLGTSQSVSAASPGPVPAVAPASARAGSDGGLVLQGTGGSAEVCVFETRGDYVHVSSSAFEASGHGWWVNGNCPTTTAVVTVQLQEYYSDGVWRNVGGKGKSTVRSGGGSQGRATGRGPCKSSAVTSWRSVVDVDLVGLSDSPEKLVTAGRDLACRL
ncbi:hypothetical protein Slala03_69160 [Streptomyces lavendulae subsp. lavendulae]|uniref:hypothetical protein n=1 Tax=Streptomyces lavendulae TaxID=1914 RepID=UPI0024A2DBEA|nr:hypothetical protein [Streptomyces lavendulae]GLV87227.1 hypothetical protein Slala03_69160 [Streptomyces lavendulae subsp. lavendulae]